MAIIALRAWYLEKYEPVKELEKRPQDLRLSKNSLLKTGLRADFLEESDQVKRSTWFGRYLDGETVEFYIEGSGGYAISNIDLISHEIYFTKLAVMAQLDPIIFLCYQTEYADSSEALREALQKSVEELNLRSRLPLTIEESHRPTEGPLRLSSMLVRKIRKSLLFVADGTPIASIPGERGTSAQLVPSPKVCLEMGYALQSKRSEQILLAQMERKDIAGQFPFEVPNYQQLSFKNAAELAKILRPAIEVQLQRFNLFNK